MKDSAPSYGEVVQQLRLAYDTSAAERDETLKSEWKVGERQLFLERLLSEGKHQLLEIGAGTGQDSVFFQDHDVNVVATDPSANMVARCRAKGVSTYAMDVLHLDFPPESFDSAYAFNCLLHVPNADFPAALTSIRKTLRPGALFYVGVYGSSEPFEGVLPNDWHIPARFFSLRTDDQILDFVRGQFELLDFHVVQQGRHFQSLTLRC